MSSIDDRIVQMQFDNDQFQKGVAQTNSSLDDLKDHLQLTGASDGMNNIQKTADSINLGSIADGVQHISDAFSALGIIGINVLSSIAQDAISTGEQLIDKVVGPIVEGGEKRAIALQQANFQFQGLGLNIQATMAAALTAVKGTAFGLDDAATAAAQFGASGITAGNGLEEALRGVAGVAAQTGSSYSDIANIFEEVSGNGRLMGQNLLELSSHGVNAAAALAKSMGTTEAAVRTMVTNGDISFAQFSNAMNATFGANAANANQTFTGALANMDAALSRLGAEFDTPKIADERDALNALTPVIDNIHAALLPLINAMTAFMGISSAGIVKALGAIDLTNLTLIAPGLAASFDNLIAAIESVLGPFKAAFGEIFPPETAAGITALSVAIQKFTAGLILSASSQEDLKNTFAGLFAVIKLGIIIIGDLLGVIGNILGFATLGQGGILSLTGSLGLFLVKVTDVIENGDALNKFFTGLENVLKIPIDAVHLLVEGIEFLIDAIESLFSQKGIDDFASDTTKNFSGLIALGQFFTTVFNGIKEVAQAVITFLSPMLAVLEGIINDVAKNVSAALGQMKFTDALGAINTGLFAGFLLIVNGFFGNLRGALAGNGVAIVSSFKKVFGQLQVNLKALQQSVNAKTIETIAIAVALLAASAVALSLVNPGRLGVAMSAITVGFGDLLASFAILQKIPTTGGFLKAPSIAATLILMAVAIDLLAIAILLLAGLDWDGLAKGLTGLTVMMAVLVAAAKALNDSSPRIIIGAAAMVLMAAAIDIMVNAVTDLAGLSWEQLAKGVVGLVAVMALLVGMTKTIGNPARLILTGTAILLLAGAMKVLAGVVVDFAGLSWEDLGKGIGGLAAALIAVGLAIRLLPNNLVVSSTGLILVATALKIIAGVIKDFGNMSFEEIGKGLVTLAGAMLILVVALNLMDGTVSGSLALVIAAAGLTLIANAMKIFGSMDWDSIGRAITLLAASLTILAIVLTFMGDPLVLLGSAALIIAAAALMVLAPAMKLLGTISWDSIGRGLTVLAAAIVILAAGGLLLIVAIPGLLGVAIALALIGTAVLEAGIGITLFAAALAALAIAGPLALGLVTDAITAFIGQLPALATALGAAVGAFALQIATQGPALVAAFTTVLLSLITAFNTAIPPLIVAATNFIVALVNAIVILVPLLVDAGLQIVGGVLAGIANNIGNLVTQGAQIVINFLNGVGANLPGIIQAGINLILDFINGLAQGIRNNTAALNTAGGNLASAIIDGMTSGLRGAVGAVVRAAQNLANAIPAAIRKLLGIASPSKVTTQLGVFIGQGLAQGIDSQGNAIETSAQNMGDVAIKALTKSISGVSAIVGENIDIQPTITPIVDLNEVKKGSLAISGLLGGTQTIGISKTANAAQAVNAGVSATQQVSTDADGLGTNQGSAPAPAVQFIQNNTSPKALSNADIYRQTRNQISVAKGVLTTLQ